LSEIADIDLVVIPGAGSSGLTWRPVSDLLPIRILPVPDAPTVPAMAEELLSDLADDRPRVLIGASLGAMVALELARRVRVDAFVPVAAGPGITVSETLLEWIRTGDNVLAKVARMSLADPGIAENLALATEDLESRGRDQLHRHLSALAAYRPTEFPAVERTVVIWGVKDRSVPAEDHVELAVRMKGWLAPVPEAGHKPFLESPSYVARIIQQVRAWVAAERKPAS
jgi:pimeloyl-ACP methyl ester carboxylesterase